VTKAWEIKTARKMIECPNRGIKCSCGCADLRSELTASLFPIAKHFSKLASTKHPVLEFDDCFQDLMMIGTRVVDKYNPERGTRLFTVAYVSMMRRYYQLCNIAMYPKTRMAKYRFSNLENEDAADELACDMEHDVRMIDSNDVFDQVVSIVAKNNEVWADDMVAMYGRRGYRVTLRERGRERGVTGEMIRQSLLRSAEFVREHAEASAILING
jgi:hypothetical protein